MKRAISIDPYVLDTLMRDLVGHDHRPSAYLVYLAILAENDAGQSHLSHAALADRTGLSKRAVQDAIRHLAGRSLIAMKRSGRTEAAAVTALRPWQRGA